METLDHVLAQADMLCIEDYNKGLLTPELVPRAIDMARGRSMPILIDPAAINDYSKYANATALKLNRTETEKATGMPVGNEPQYAGAASDLIEKLNLEAAIITLDKNGAYPGTREEEDAGSEPGSDTFTMSPAPATWCWRCWPSRGGRGELEEPVALANVAGGLEVERVRINPHHPRRDHPGAAQRSPRASGQGADAGAAAAGTGAIIAPAGRKSFSPMAASI